MRRLQHREAVRGLELTQRHVTLQRGERVATSLAVREQDDRERGAGGGRRSPGVEGRRGGPGAAEHDGADGEDELGGPDGDFGGSADEGVVAGMHGAGV